MSKREVPSFPPARTATAANAILQQLKGMDFHVLCSASSIDRIPEQHEIVFNSVLLDPRKGGGDVWGGGQIPSGYVALTHDALIRIWNAAGGQINESFAAETDLHMVVWKVFGRIREMGGSWTSDWASRRIDLRDGGAEALRMKDDQLKQQRADIFQLSESKAKNRLIRKMLGIRQKYPEAEAAWPFIAVRPLLIVNMNDPMQKMMFLADSMGATAQLFGNPKLMKFLASNMEDTEDVENGDLLPAAIEQKAIPASASATVTEADVKVAKPKEAEIQLTTAEARAEFVKLTANMQILTLENFVKSKNYDVRKLTAPIANFTEAHRLAFFDKLYSMPDAEKPATTASEAPLPFDL